MAVAASEIEGALSAYLNAYPAEAKRLRALLAQLREPDRALRDRSAQPGHVTASALLFHPDGRVLFLIDDKRKRFLLPGGHADIDDPDLPSAARRELFEETGIPQHTVAPFPGSVPGHPIDIGIRKSNGSKRLGESRHTHWDFRYPMITTSPVRELLPDHSACYQWLPVAAAPPHRVAGKLSRLLANVAATADA